MAAPQKPQWQRKKDARLEYLVWRNGALGASKGDSQGSQALIGKDKDLRGPLTPNRSPVSLPLRTAIGQLHVPPAPWLCSPCLCLILAWE